MHARGIGIRPAKKVGVQCPLLMPLYILFLHVTTPKSLILCSSYASHTLPPSPNLLSSSNDCGAKPTFKVFCVQLLSTMMRRDFCME